MMRRDRALDVSSYPLSSEVTRTKSAYEASHGKDPLDRGGWYSDDDWRRVNIVLDSIAAGTLLDVGAGAGQFVNAAALSPLIESIHAIDVGRFNKYRDYSGRIDYQIMPAVQMSFPDDAFDTVTCLEVLEHVPDEAVTRIVEELHRVSRSRVIITVPFRESRPLSTAHLRRFARRDLIELFPDGHVTILSRHGSQWALVEVGGDLPERARQNRAAAAAAHAPGRAGVRRVTRSLRRALAAAVEPKRRT